MTGKGRRSMPGGDTNPSSFSANKSKTGLLADCLLILILSLLTVNALAPRYLNADVILNSVMSLQKVTIFVWGQNRLLNVVPFLLSFIADPEVNLRAHLIFFSCTFYTLLYVLAGLISSLLPPPSALGHRETFLLTTASTVLIFRPHALFDFALWHIEYTLSYLLLIGAFRLLFSRGKLPVSRLLSTSLLLFIATGLNNSILLPALAIAAFFPLLAGYGKRGAFFGALAALASFAGWYGISGYYPAAPASYYGVNLSNLLPNLLETLQTMASAVSLPGLMGLFGLVLFFYLFIRKGSSKWEAPLLPLLPVFAAGWILLFSNNQWVIANQYHYRYFAPAFFCCILTAVLLLAAKAALLKPLPRALLFSLLLGFLLFRLAAPFTPLKEYTVFSAAFCPAERPGPTFYAGDYWKVWPAVMGDLMAGKESFGFAFRGDANKEAASSCAAKQITEEEKLTVYCLDASPEECLSQTASFLGGLSLKEEFPLSPHCVGMILEQAPEWKGFPRLGQGFFGWEERVGLRCWSEKRSSRLFIPGTSGTSGEGVLKMKLGTLIPRTVKIKNSRGEIFSFALDPATIQPVEIPFPLTREEQPISFITDRAGVVPDNGDPRTLAFCLLDVSIEKRKTTVR